MVKRINHRGVEWLQYEELSKHKKLRHASLLRHGGVSTAPYDSLNFSADVGDNPLSVESNHKIATAALSDHWKLSHPMHWHRVNQMHGFDHCVIESSQKNEQKKADILITNTPYQTLAISHADCQAAIFYDAKNHALAVVHCGWRGNVLNVYARAVELMQEHFKTNPCNLHVALSPSLGPKHSEFINYEREFPSELWPYKKAGHRFDLWQIAFDQLIALGIPSKQIELSKICTFENQSDCFSYRRDPITGRHVTVAVLL